jgi:hypothetical protein
MTIRTNDHCLITAESVERAFDHHERDGKIRCWHNWHETRPGRKRPLYTVTLASGTVLDIATLWEAHALCAGLAQINRAAYEASRGR